MLMFLLRSHFRNCTTTVAGSISCSNPNRCIRWHIRQYYRNKVIILGKLLRRNQVPRFSIRFMIPNFYECSWLHCFARHIQMVYHSKRFFDSHFRGIWVCWRSVIIDWQAILVLSLSLSRSYNEPTPCGRLSSHTAFHQRMRYEFISLQWAILVYLNLSKR